MLNSFVVFSGLPQIPGKPGNLEKPGKRHFLAKTPGKPGKLRFLQRKERLKPGKPGKSIFSFFSTDKFWKCWG